MSCITLLLLDLDDTLLDTTRLLAPAAHRDAIDAMVAAGLPGRPEALLAERLLLSRRVPPDRLSVAQLDVHGIRAPHIAEAGDRAYFDREVPPIALEPGVAAMLRRLHVGRALVLVTSGVERTQRAKVRRLGLEWLDAIAYVPVGGAEVKEEAFHAAAAARGCSPEHIAVVGDRLDSEIVAGNRMGAWTVHVDRGEGERRATSGLLGRPDEVIRGPLELEAAVARLEARILAGEHPVSSAAA